MEESKNSDYGQSTKANQNSVAFGFMQRLWNSYANKEISLGGMDSYIKDFNDNNAGDLKISTIGGYDEPMDVVIKNGNGQSKPKTVKKMNNPHE